MKPCVLSLWAKIGTKQRSLREGMWRITDAIFSLNLFSSRSITSHYLEGSSTQANRDDQRAKFLPRSKLYVYWRCFLLIP